MKIQPMKTYFNLPVTIQNVELDANEVKRDSSGKGMECAAVSHAVNYHDELVEALSNLIVGRRTCSPDSFFDLIKQGEKLLDKIKGE